MKLLSIEGLYKQYDQENLALSNFSLKISKGSVWSLVGEIGSGKSTLLRIIAGLEVQDQGKVYLNGNKILNPSEKLVAGYEEIQLVHQQNNLYPHSTVEENIVRPLLQYDKGYKEERLELMLALLGLQPHRHKLPKQLSGGQQQKLAIGKALGIEPEVLLLDEPFSNLDNIQKRQLIEELKLIFEKLKVTVLLVTHDIEDAMTMTERLVIIKKGKLIQKGNVRKIHERPKNLYVARFFSDLNPFPDQPNAYIRPSDLIITSHPQGIQGKVIAQQYLAPFNQLKILLQNSDMEWKVEDRKRQFGKGDQVYLKYEKRKVLQF